MIDFAREMNRYQCCHNVGGPHFEKRPSIVKQHETRKTTYLYGCHNTANTLYHIFVEYRQLEKLLQSHLKELLLVTNFNTHIVNKTNVFPINLLFNY